ncbi:hypothetical protein Vqi01_22330 [Micromonospora qiuiae]|uniref:Uncharacterized protein n=1 Tax=Micromonospora qiuiae TaxID=502268 RepID=A0ABQ4JA85_9ACTN|nr:hypothetical protein Vqi01_22330 [Micromonospora qiuiae]
MGAGLLIPAGATKNVHVRGDDLSAPARGDLGDDVPDHVFLVKRIKVNTVQFDPVPGAGTVPIGRHEKGS